MSRYATRSALFPIGALIVLTTVGCGSPAGPTSGVLRFDDGTPVTSGSIEFRSLRNGQRFASRISTEGEFHPANQDQEMGLPPGSYEVVVVQMVLTEDLVKEAHTHGNTVPRRYADYYTSDLKVDIAEGVTTPIELMVDSR